MGSLREEMEKIMNDWKNNHHVHAQPQPQPQPQPQQVKEIEVQNNQQQVRVSKITGRPIGAKGYGTFSNEVLNDVRQHAGCNGVQIRDAMLKTFPMQRFSQTASTLKSLADGYWVARKPIVLESGQKTYVYEAIPEENRDEVIRKAKENLAKLRNNAAIARAALAQKRAEARAEAERQEKSRLPDMPTMQMPLTPPAYNAPLRQAAMIEQNVPPKQETSPISIRLTLTIAGQDVRVTVQEAVQLHRQLSEFLGFGV